MNDMRRTLLWSVFAFSLLMLWDGWLRHTGQPSLFAPAPVVAEAPASGASSASGVPAAATALPGAVAAASAAQAASAPAAVPHELVTITTDVDGNQTVTAPVLSAASLRSARWAVRAVAGTAPYNSLFSANAPYLYVLWGSGADLGTLVPGIDYAAVGGAGALASDVSRVAATDLVTSSFHTGDAVVHAVAAPPAPSAPARPNWPSGKSSSATSSTGCSATGARRARGTIPSSIGWCTSTSPPCRTPGARRRRPWPPTAAWAGW